MAWCWLGVFWCGSRGTALEAGEADGKREEDVVDIDIDVDTCTWLCTYGLESLSTQDHQQRADCSKGGIQLYNAVNKLHHMLSPIHSHHP